MNWTRTGVFITGTDTDVGKTVAASAVLVSLRTAGIDAVPMKPVQTGGMCEGGLLVSPDLQFCLRNAGLEVCAEEHRLMAPYVFEPACSPHLAAAECGCEIDLERIATAYAGILEGHECVVVEGAGGLLVPLSPHRTMLDLMVLLGLPVILVARPGLGTLNHTLLSLRELERSRLTVLGVILCQARGAEWGRIEQDNLETIERLAKVSVIGRIPHMPGLPEGRVAPHAFRDLTLQHLRLPCTGS